MDFPGSNFFSDSKFLEKQNFASKAYDLPLLINRRITIIQPNSKYRPYLRKYLNNYTKFYRIQGFSKECKKIPKIIHEHHVSSVPRFKDNRTVSLPPNHFNLTKYDLAQLIKKQTGTKGSFACFSGERNDKTIIGHHAPKKCKGSRTMFYNIPNGIDILNHPRKNFVMKIRPGIRITTNIPNADFPEPSRYYPLNHCIKKVAEGRRLDKEPLVFFPASCVPESERFIHRKPFQPGVGRYQLEEIACPCRRGQKQYDYELQRKNELFNINSYVTRRKKTTISMARMCCQPKMRNISGHGHTWVFKSNVKRLISQQKSKIANMKNKELKLMNDPHYMEMIQHPKRKKLSFPLMKIGFSIGTLRFNTVERPAKRSKLRANKRVGFLSGVPRFKDLRQMSKSEFFTHRSPNIPARIDAKTQKQRTDELLPPLRRLCKLPERFELLKITLPASDKSQTFQPLPKARILVEESECIPDDQLDRVNRLKIEELYKNEFLGQIEI